MTRRVLLTGATGFVGSRVYSALVAAGHEVRCATRRPTAARLRHPEREWVYLDLHERESLAPALSGCDAALYLVHEIGTAADYAEREAEHAADFRRAAEAAGVERITYLGGVVPTRGGSRHLEARRATGHALRGGRPLLFELRAAMIVGRGSASWDMVSGLAAFPALPSPPWLENTSWPIAVADVVRALVLTLELPGAQAGCYELPGPERLTHREVLTRTGRALGRAPAFVSIPWVPTGVSGRALGLLTGVDHRLAAELLAGIRVDLEPSGPSFWSLVPDAAQTGLATAIFNALYSTPALARAS